MNSDKNHHLRLAFLCGSLEPGCDGVGDYVRTLALELQKLGHLCLCIAINDRYVGQADSIRPEPFSSSGLLVLRFSSSSPWVERFTHLSNQLAYFEPDWISLQFVPYAFHDKGLPIQLRSGLAKISSRANWNIMIHELWVDPSVNLAYLLISKIQKIVVCRLISSLAPKALHASNPYYQLLLQRAGLAPIILPLFSNISLVSGLDEVAKKGSVWIFVFFGAIHPEWEPMHLLGAIASVSQDLQLSQCLFLSIGNSGAHGQRLWTDLERQDYPLFRFQMLGKLSKNQISSLLKNSDFGITTVPSHLLGKSGSVAAMIAHGLPVIVPRLSSKSKAWDHELKASGRFVLFDSDFEAALLKARKYPPHDQLPLTARQFIEDLRSPA